MSPAASTPLPSIAFLGAGRVATTLARALVAAEVPIAAIASRDPEPARRLAASTGATAMPMADAAREALVFITVSDDAIEPVAAGITWRADQMVVHCSGATEVAALAAAARTGAAVGGFHPLQTFSDPDAALAHLRGATVAIEASGSLDDALRAIAARLGLVPITLPAGARALYHGGAGFAAGFLVPMLEEAVTAWKSFGVDEAEALRALLPLATGTIAAIAAKGLAGALAGPVPRGDVNVIERHLAAIDALGPEHGALYRGFARRQLRLARLGDRLSIEQAARVAAALNGTDG